MSPYHCDNHEIPHDGKQHRNDQPRRKNNCLQMGPTRVHVIIAQWPGCSIGGAVPGIERRRSSSRRNCVTRSECRAVIGEMVVWKGGCWIGYPNTGRHFIPIKSASKQREKDAMLVSAHYLTHTTRICYLFVCLLILIPLENFSLIWWRLHCRWKSTLGTHGHWTVSATPLVTQVTRFKVISNHPKHKHMSLSFSSGPVNTCFNDLGLSWRRIEHPTICTQERIPTTPGFWNLFFLL